MIGKVVGFGGFWIGVGVDWFRIGIIFGRFVVGFVG